MGELTTEQTKARLSERLRAITNSLATEGGGDLSTAKFIFDLRAAADLLDGLDGLLAKILMDEIQEDGNPALGRVLFLAEELREKLTKANPELKHEPPSFEEREEVISAYTEIPRQELVDLGFEPEVTRPDIGDGWIVQGALDDERFDKYACFSAGGYVIITGREE